MSNHVSGICGNLNDTDEVMPSASEGRYTLCATGAGQRSIVIGYGAKEERGFH